MYRYLTAAIVNNLQKTMYTIIVNNTYTINCWDENHLTENITFP